MPQKVFTDKHSYKHKHIHTLPHAYMNAYMQRATQTCTNTYTGKAIYIPQTPWVDQIRSLACLVDNRKGKPIRLLKIANEGQVEIPTSWNLSGGKMCPQI